MIKKNLRIPVVLTLVSLLIFALLAIASGSEEEKPINKFYHEDEIKQEIARKLSVYDLTDLEYEIKIESGGMDYTFITRDSKFEKLSDRDKYHMLKNISDVFFESDQKMSIDVFTELGEPRRYYLEYNSLKIYHDIIYSEKSVETNKTYSNKNYSDSEYWTVAKHVVTNNLKSPSSSKFPWYNDSSIQHSGGNIIVSSYVDADNSYGAKIRIYFKITFIDGDVDNYTTEFN